VSRAICPMHSVFSCGKRRHADSFRIWGILMLLTDFSSVTSVSLLCSYRNRFRVDACLPFLLICPQASTDDTLLFSGYLTNMYHLQRPFTSLEEEGSDWLK
jgi:hypothetical protein